MTGGIFGTNDEREAARGTTTSRWREGCAREGKMLDNIRIAGLGYQGHKATSSARNHRIGLCQGHIIVHTIGGQRNDRGNFLQIIQPTLIDSPPPHPPTQALETQSTSMQARVTRSKGPAPEIRNSPPRIIRKRQRPLAPNDALALVQVIATQRPAAPAAPELHATVPPRTSLNSNSRPPSAVHTNEESAAAAAPAAPELHATSPPRHP
ncbi:hypothetical protein B0H15DRAFT_804053 [Mycena belliarum]|uniref:Uncharacterized protein n=1 Tax=Mycena belliarum TaxID=1033014 RepID=A0AAD6XM29_9AGAR|nr:hypothetical protein B0H15DRAFT_804053 [Mycena belliae]